MLLAMDKWYTATPTNFKRLHDLDLPDYDAPFKLQQKTSCMLPTYTKKAYELVRAPAPSWLSPAKLTLF